MQTHTPLCLRHKIISYSICHTITELQFIDLNHVSFHQAIASLVQGAEIYFRPLHSVLETHQRAAGLLSATAQDIRMCGEHPGGGASLNSHSDWVIKEDKMLVSYKATFHFKQCQCVI